MLGQCRIGRGRAVICNLWLLDGVLRDFPEAGYLLDCLVSYALSDRFASASPPLGMEEARRLLNIAGQQ